MAILLTCPAGHCFEAVSTGPEVCPECGARLGIPDDPTLAQADAAAPSADATLALDTAAPGGSASATLGVGAYDDAGPEELAVPGYEILEELGRGAMGVVYKARHVELHRVVALKMILSGAHAGAMERARFDREAEAVARLKHPHIVQIYEMGECDGVPFFALEYVDGGSLSQQLDGKPVPAAVAAALVAKLARAVHYAHEHGIVHRDVKPANILLALAVQDQTLNFPGPSAPPASEHTSKDRSPIPLTACAAPPALHGSKHPLMHFEPKMADFGLAKQVAGAETSDAEHWHGRTESGTILGTPSYMSPEQAGGKHANVGPASDTYALGALLYELLTGRAPFAAATPLDTVLKVLTEEPTPPRSLTSTCPRDLETVCLKCLAKDPKMRYASAAELADDLERFARGEPVRARRARAVERVACWLRRRPVAAACLLLLVVAAPWAGVHYGPSLYRRATSQGRLSVTAPSAGVRLRARPERNGPEVLIESGDEGTVTLPAGTYSLKLAEGQGGLELDKERVTIAPDGLEEVQVRLAPEPEIIPELLHSIAFQDVEQGMSAHIYQTGISADGKLFFGAGDAGPTGTIRIFDLQIGKQVQELRPGNEAWFSNAAFVPGGKYLAAAYAREKDLYVWDIATGKLVRKLIGHTDTGIGFAVSPDGKRLLSWSDDRTVRLWDPDTGKELRKFEGHTDKAAGVFSSDGKKVLTFSPDKTLLLWDTESGQQMQKLEVHTNECSLAPDGKQVLSFGADQTIRLWSLQTGKEIRRFEGKYYKEGVRGFVAGGRRVAALCDDKKYRLWDTASGKIVQEIDLANVGDDCWNITASPDGRLALVRDADGAVRVLDLSTGEEIHRYPDCRNARSFSFTADGTMAVAGSFRAGLYVFRLPRVKAQGQEKD